MSQIKNQKVFYMKNWSNLTYWEKQEIKETIQGILLFSLLLISVCGLVVTIYLQATGQIEPLTDEQIDSIEQTIEMIEIINDLSNIY